MHIKSLLLLILLSMSCSGYRLSDRSNPFSQYGVESMAVPLFYNQSNVEDVSGVFTQEIHEMLSNIDNLKIKMSDKNADAVLVGIIKSPRRVMESRKSTFRLAQDVAGESLGDQRRDFYVPATTNMQMDLQLILIKNPSKQEIETLRTELGEHVRLSSKVLFNEKISVKSRFSREILSGDSTQVNMTQNKGAERKNVRNLAKEAADSFRNMILYAF